MSTRRPPAPPPQIDGFEHVKLLGSGGFSDVFLYEQQRPRRRVAVKVLLHDLASSDARERFDHEANLMAQLSTHPSIVTIYEADVARDGRPYLAMEFCSRPSLGSTYRRDPLSVAEALRIGIQVAGAVETAHRAGILHRDIKPANILVTEYHRPALTDFGISATTDGAGEDTEGMSIPWSPPESFTDPPTSSVASDVWALGATIYSLLAGRSPFEVPGGRNGSADLISRIERVPVPPTGRSDVPASLERVLATAMAKDPLARYPSALALARAWQEVQVELSHAMTPVDVLDDSVGVVPLDDDDEPGTRVRRVTSIDPHTGEGSTGPTAPGSTLPGETVHRAPVTGAPVAAAPTDRDGAPAQGASAEHTVLRGAGQSAADQSAAVGAAPEHTVLRGAEQTHAPGDAPEHFALHGPGQTGAPASAPEHTVLRGGARDVPVFAVEDVEATVLRPAAQGGLEVPAADDAPPEPEPERQRRVWPAVVAGAGLLVAAGVAAVIVLGGGAEPPELVAPSPTASPVDPVMSIVPAPTDLASTVDGDTVTFTWTNPEPEDGDSFLWRTVSVLETGELERLAEPTVELPLADQVCIEVMLRRDSGRTSEPVRGCAP